MTERVFPDRISGVTGVKSIDTARRRSRRADHRAPSERGLDITRYAASATLVGMSTVHRVLDNFAGGARPPDARTIDKVPVYGIWFTLEAAKKAGFAGDELIVAGALAGRESFWNPWATNMNPHTKDVSYGLWQINLILPTTKRLLFQDLGLALGEVQLLDAETNARAARWLYNRSASVPFYAWGPYKDILPLWGSAARNVQVVYDIAAFFGYVPKDGE